MNDDEDGYLGPGLEDAGTDEIATSEALRIIMARKLSDPDISARDLAPLSTRYQQVITTLRDARTAAAEAAEAARAAKEAEIAAFDPDDI